MNSALIDSPVMNVDEAAEYLRVSRASVWRLLKSSTLTRVRVGARVVIRKSELDALIAKP